MSQSMEELIKIFSQLQQCKDEDELIDCCYEIKKIITRNLNNHKLLLDEKILPFLKTGLKGLNPNDINGGIHPEVTVTTLKMVTLAIRTRPDLSIPYFQQHGLLALSFKQIESESIEISQSVLDMFKIIIMKKQDNKCILLPDGIGNYSNWFPNTFTSLIQEYAVSNKIIFFRLLVIGSLLLNLELDLEEKDKLEVSTNNSNGIRPTSTIQNNIDIDASSSSTTTATGTSQYEKDIFEKYREPFISILVRVFNNSSDDIMTQMNILEIIEEACKYSVALKSIIKAGLIKSLIELLVKTTSGGDQGSLSNTPILNKAISFLSNVSQISNEKTLLIFGNGIGDMLVNCFKYHLNHTEEPLSRKLKMSILTAIGIIGKNSKGLDLIIKDNEFMKCYTEYLLSNDQETIATAYTSFSIMLKSNEKYYTVSDKLYQIYQSLPDGLLTSKLTKNYQSPIEDIKHSTYALIQSLSIHSWGASEVIKMPGFFEYLLNRQNENTKLAKEWKFYIIQTIVNQHKDLFNSNAEWRDRYHQFESYLKKGVNFVPFESQTKIANEFEG